MCVHTVMSNSLRPPGTALLSMGFSRKECWSGFPFPTPEDVTYPGIETVLPVAPPSDGKFFTVEPPGKLSLSI